MNYERIKQLEESELSIELLRDGLILRNDIGRLLFREKITEAEYKQISDNIDNIFINKFKALNPELNQSILEKMVCPMHRGRICVPKDIIVINNAVFFIENQLDDFGEVYTKKFLTPEGWEENDVKNIDDGLTFNSCCWIEELDFNDGISSEKTKCIIDSIVKLLNETLKDEIEYLNPDVPIFSSMNDINFAVFRNYWTPNIYLGLNFPQICEAYTKGEEVTFRLITYNESDEFSNYNVTMKVVDGKIEWSTEKVDMKPWRLSVALNKELGKVKEKK